MGKISTYMMLLSLIAGASSRQVFSDDADFALALPSHNGQLRWHADGFKIVESSAKPGGAEIGIRGKDAAGRLTFLGFLFLFPEQAPLTSARCRDEVLQPEKRDTPTLQIQATSELAASEGPPIALATYTAQTKTGRTQYMVRAFVAAADICGDLEFYSETPIDSDDPEMRRILQSYRFDPNYVPQINDVSLYAQILYQHQMFKAAAPIFEQALAKIPDDKAYGTMRRVTTDQAGMAYGIAGDIPKSRAVFEAAVAKDPDYPLYYYNLACADAEENKLADARIHLQQAFARKANVIPGENMPDPTKDDSFLPYRDNKDFWEFIQSLH